MFALIITLITICAILQTANAVDLSQHKGKTVNDLYPVTKGGEL